MSVGIKLALAKKVDENESSNVLYVYDNCDIERIGINGRYTDQGVGFGLLYQDIKQFMRFDFVKINDPIITRRLQRAFSSRKKNRKLSLMIQEGVTGYEIKFRDIKVVSFRQQFENIYSEIGPIPLLKDIVTVQAESVDSNF